VAARGGGDNSGGAPGGLDERVADELRRLLAGLQHGSITLIVQDGRIVQIDATRKLRLDARRPPERRSG
jgi:hypothetical protein